MPPAKGRNKIDLHVGANLGVFGLLRPDQFTGLATGEKAAVAVKTILEKFSFPSLNIIFSASARLRQQDNDSSKVETRLDKMEVRLKIKPLDANGVTIADPNKCVVLGLHPFETKADKEDPAVQMTPDVSGLLGAIPGISPDITGIVSALGLTFAPLFKPKFPILEKAFLASRDEFGWFLRSFKENQKEGVHYGVSFLQLSREVKFLQIDVNFQTDWEGGDVDVQTEKPPIRLEVKHPDPPRSPQITDFTSPDELPLVIPRSDVKSLLSLTDPQLNAIIEAKKLDAFGEGGQVVTKGSLLKLLGL